MSGSSYCPRSAVYVHGTAPFSRIQATATEVSRPPEKAMPTRSPTGSEVRTLDMNVSICIGAHTYPIAPWGQAVPALRHCCAGHNSDAASPRGPGFIARDLGTSADGRAPGMRVARSQERDRATRHTSAGGASALAARVARGAGGDVVEAVLLGGATRDVGVDLALLGEQLQRPHRD